MERYAGREDARALKRRHQVLVEMERRGWCGDGARVASEDCLVIFGVLRIRCPPAGDIGR